MASKALKFCLHPGCRALADKKYCEAHKGDEVARAAQYDRLRKNANQRGYNYQWGRYSKAYLAHPDHQLCALHLDGGCAVIAQCVDHVKPANGAGDPLFWDPANHQPACIHCNSVKGHKFLRGEYVLGGGGVDTTDQPQ